MSQPTAIYVVLSPIKAGGLLRRVGMQVELADDLASAELAAGRIGRTVAAPLPLPVPPVLPPVIAPTPPLRRKKA